MSRKLPLLLAVTLAIVGCNGHHAPPDGPAGPLPIYPFAPPLLPGSAQLIHGSPAEVELATRLRPYLFFDTTERWRPLDVDAFLAEHFADGTGNQVLLDRDYLEVHGHARNGADYASPEARTCMDAREAIRIARTSPPNCDRGARPAMYYRRTSHGGLWYWDYWVFYRYNDYTGHFNHCFLYCDDHEGDWEGVTLVTDKTLVAPRIVGAIYAVHADRLAIATSALVVPTGHVAVYVAAGTHASYRFRCGNGCGQYLAGRPEDSHDGGRPWDLNDDAACAEVQCVKPLPERAGAGDEAAPSPASWNAWTALWGSTCLARCNRDLNGPSPKSPGRQERFNCPWIATRVDQAREVALGLRHVLPSRAKRAQAPPEGCPKAVPVPDLTAPELLAMGDSYSAGEGAGEYDPATLRATNSCHRSANAWPFLLGRSRGLPTRSVACSGARTPEVVTSGVRTDEAERSVSQISRIPSPPPELVTITIGGNDVHFSNVLGHCIYDDDCTKRYTADGHDRIQDDIDDVERKLPALYRAIERAAPGSRLVVVGYPRIFPHSVPDTPTPNCAAWDRLSEAEVDYLNRRTHSLNLAIERAAGAAQADFVDVEDAFDNHELRCVGASSVNRLHLIPTWPFYSHESFHPNVAGQARLAAVVGAALRG